jgi:hypothetical protein
MVRIPVQPEDVQAWKITELYLSVNAIRFLDRIFGHRSVLCTHPAFAKPNMSLASPHCHKTPMESPNSHKTLVPQGHWNPTHRLIYPGNSQNKKLRTSQLSRLWTKPASRNHTRDSRGRRSAHNRAAPSADDNGGARLGGAHSFARYPKLQKSLENCARSMLRCNSDGVTMHWGNPSSAHERRGVNMRYSNDGIPLSIAHASPMRKLPDPPESGYGAQGPGAALGAATI